MDIETQVELPHYSFDVVLLHAQLILPSVDVGPISIEKALRLLGPHGWVPTPMREWLGETVAWNMSKDNRHYTKHVDDD